MLVGGQVAQRVAVPFTGDAVGAESHDGVEVVTLGPGIELVVRLAKSAGLAGVTVALSQLLAEESAGRCPIPPR